MRALMCVCGTINQDVCLTNTTNMTNTTKCVCTTTNPNVCIQNTTKLTNPNVCIQNTTNLTQQNVCVLPRIKVCAYKTQPK